MDKISIPEYPGRDLNSLVAKAGYDAVSANSELYEKKGLFSAFKR